MPQHSAGPVEKRNDPRVKILALIALGVLLLAYHGAYYDVQINMYDEGLIMEGAQRVIDGRLDFEAFSHYSTVYALVARLQRIFGPNLLTFRALSLLLRTAMGLLGFLIARRFVSTLPALLAVALLITSSGPWHKTFIPFFIILNLYLMIRWLEDGRRRWLGLAGLSISMIGGIHIYTAAGNALASAAVLLIPRFSRHHPDPNRIRCRRQTLINAGWMTGGIIVGIILFCPSIFEINWIDWTRRTVAVVQSDRLTYQNLLALLVRGDVINAEYSTLLRGALMDWPWVSVLALALLIKRVQPERRWFLVTVAIFSLAHFPKVLARFDPPHLLQNAGPSILLLAWLSQIDLNRPPGPSQPRRRLSLISILALSFSFATIVDGLNSRDYYRGSIGMLRQPHLTRLPFDRAPVRIPAETAEYLTALVKYVQQHTTEDEPILAAPECPMIYFLANRRNPSSVTLFDRPEAFYAISEAEALAEIQSADLNLWVFHDVVPDDLAKNRFENVAPDIAAYLRTEFKPVRRFNDYQVWKRVPNATEK